MARLSEQLDFINVMTYDFHGAWDRVTGFNAPLKPKTSEHTVKYAISYWIQLGADSRELVMGILLYGRTFTLAGSQNDLGVPAIGGGMDGPYKPYRPYWT